MKVQIYRNKDVEINEIGRSKPSDHSAIVPLHCFFSFCTHPRFLFSSTGFSSLRCQLGTHRHRHTHTSKHSFARPAFYAVTELPRSAIAPSYITSALLSPLPPNHTNQPPKPKSLRRSSTGPPGQSPPPRSSRSTPHGEPSPSPPHSAPGPCPPATPPPPGAWSSRAAARGC